MPENQKKNENPMPTVISRADSLLLCAAIVLFTALLVWMIFGTIRTSFTEIGVLITENDAEIIHQPFDAVVTELLVSENSYVHEGDALARIFPVASDDEVEVDSLNDIKAQALSVHSPVSGYVSEISVSLWDEVNISTPLMMVLKAPSEQISNALTYVTLNSIDQIEVGTKVKIEPEGIGRNVGSLSGRVSKIGQLPSSLYDMEVRTGSEKTAQYLFQDRTEQFLVEIELEKDADGKPIATGGKVPESAFITNKICTLTFYSNERHPYQVLLQNKE